MQGGLVSRDQARRAVGDLVTAFQEGRRLFKGSGRYDEAKLRAGFIDPFFEALGWPVKESQRRFGRDREVVVEDRAGTGRRRRPDYGFYRAGELKYYVEAKAPSHAVRSDLDAIFQLKSYVWSQRAPLGILTNFEELRAFHGAFRPRRDEPDLGRVAKLTLSCDEYVDRFDLLYDTLSREAVGSGAIERLLAEELAKSVRQRGQLERDLFKARGARPVDMDFLEDLTAWREAIAKELARCNSFREGSELTEAVQRFLDRLVFARVAEDRGIERSHTLLHTVEAWEKGGRRTSLYGEMIRLFGRIELQFNGGLFSHHPLSDNAAFGDDDLLRGIVRGLYFPASPYRFDAMPVEILGSAYEQFLGSLIRITKSGSRAKVEPKPEVRHAGGVYYTPRHVVDFIVERTIGPLLRGATPKRALGLRVLDPACGSGSFLLGAYQFLIDWHLRQYARSEKPGRGRGRPCYVDVDGNLRLTLDKKREILTRCIFGVDIDPQAVEVTQMSLYLKLMEDEAEETLALQRSREMFKADRYLPDLSRNIRAGNSLIQPQDLFSQEDGVPAGDLARINPFDWRARETGFGALLDPRVADGPGFDAIIGNPPYIRVQELNRWAPVEVEAYKRLYASARAGNYDVYVVFIERCLGLLKETGRLGFIVPTKWWVADYGAALRALLRRGRHLSEIADFAHEQVFEDPTTYTCVSTFTRSPSDAVRYERRSPEDLRSLGAAAPARYSHDLPWKSLGSEGEPWYPGVPSAVRPLFDRLRSEGPFLGDASICSRVFQGLKTSLDSVYVLDVLGREGDSLRLWSSSLSREVALDPDLLKPLVKGGELQRFSPREPKRMILFPYEVHADEAALIPAAKLTAEFERTWRYLLENKGALDRREGGRFSGESWYQYGRTQALAVVSRPKILTADLRNEMGFSLDSTGRLFLLGGAAGGYGLIPAREEYGPLLLAILNSKLLEWMLRPPGFSTPFRGGWFSCEARFINLLPVRFPEAPADRQSMSSLALRAVDEYRGLWEARSEREESLRKRQIEALEAEIDDRVFRLYGVSERERREVERRVGEARQEADPAGRVDRSALGATAQGDPMAPSDAAAVGAVAGEDIAASEPSAGPNERPG